ncbi:hypothetical protein [Phycicoccus ginsengisoli]
MGGQYGGMDTTTPTDDDTLGALLTAAAPALPELDPDRTAGLARALAAEVVEADRTLRGRVRTLRRRHKVATVATAAAIVLVPSGAWAAQHFLAQTGTYGNPAVNPDFEDGSEMINLCAKDFPEFVSTLAPTNLPTPPGHSWAEYAKRVAKNWDGDGSCATARAGYVQATSLQSDLITQANDDWGCSLVWAARDGDPKGAATARAAMLALAAEEERITTIEGTNGIQSPDVFLSNSRRPDFTGCQR